MAMLNSALKSHFSNDEWKLLQDHALLVFEEGGEVYCGNMTGYSHYEYEKCARYLDKGAQLSVKRDHTNLYDSKATGIFYCGQQIGWIPKSENYFPAQVLDRGYTCKCVVVEHRRHLPRYDQMTLIIRVVVDETPKHILELQDRYNKLSQTFDSDKVATTLTSQSTTKGTTMKDIVNKLATKQMDLGTSAAFLEAGRLANKQVSSIAGKKLPIMLRGYAETPLGRLIIANLASMAGEHLRPGDTRVEKLTNAMIVTAYQEVLQQFDIEQFLDDFLSNATIKRALRSVEEQEEVVVATSSKPSGKESTKK